ncbi:MAG: HopJ type III effector protein [Chromatiales bacterium]|jgi:hypothetical protein
MQLEEFLDVLNSSPESISFEDCINVIKQHYDYRPSVFRNGAVNNAAGSNEGSCKIFAFARLHSLSEQQTLACFGHYYRDDVLRHPHGTNHANIRQFIQTGWPGIQFERDDVLTPRK